MRDVQRNITVGYKYKTVMSWFESALAETDEAN